MADGTTYYVRVVVRDNAGNEGKSAADNGGTSAITPSANTPPYNASTSAPTGSRTTTSLTITASATDREQTSLNYSLYFNGSFKQTVSGTRGSSVTFNAITGLSKATNYSWYVTISDGYGGSIRINGTSYTNCPGSTSPSVCVKCSGMAYLCKTCSGVPTVQSTSGTCTWTCLFCNKNTTCLRNTLGCNNCYGQNNLASSGVQCLTCGNYTRGTMNSYYFKECSNCNGYGCIKQCEHGQTQEHTII